jgi:hypothetical protein
MDKLAYLAGFTDGEGSIMYTRNGFDKRRNKYYYRIIFSLCSNDPEVLDWVLDNFPNKWNIQYRAATDKHAASWIIRLHGGRAVWLIKKLYPYLIIKKDQARIAMLAGYYHSLLHGGPKSRKYDKYLEPVRERLCKEMKRLNYRGSMAVGQQVGELLEPLIGNAKGNQQPRRVNDIIVARKVQRLMVEESTDNTNTSAHPERDDIVQSSQ